MVNLDSMSPTSLGPEGNSPGGGSRRPHWQKAPPNQTQDALWSAESLRFLSPPFQVLSTMWKPMQGKYLWQFTEVPSVDVSTDALVGVMHVLTHISESIGSSQQREQLVLLGLVVQDLRLRVSVGQGSTSKVNFRSKLWSRMHSVVSTRSSLIQLHNVFWPFPPKRQSEFVCFHWPWPDFRLVSDGTVADGDGASLGKAASRVANDHWTDEHHGPISQLGTRWLHIGPIWLHLVEKNVCFGC